MTQVVGSCPLMGEINSWLQTSSPVQIYSVHAFGTLTDTYVGFQHGRQKGNLVCYVPAPKTRFYKEV